MKHALWMAALLLALVSLLAMLLTRDRTVTVEGPGTAPVVEDREPALSGAEVPRGAARKVVEKDGKVEFDGTPSAERSHEAFPAPAIVRGRYLLPGGDPAAGVKIKVSATLRQSGLATPEGWSDPETESASDGSFSAAFIPPEEDTVFAMDSTLTGHASEMRFLNGVHAGAELDLGSLTLTPGGSVEGRLVDSNGDPLGGDGWTVIASPAKPFRGAENKFLHGDGDDEIDPATGMFRILDLPPGLATLSAWHSVTVKVPGPRAVS